MQVEIVSPKLSVRTPLRHLVDTRLRYALGPFRRRITAITVTFEPLAGARGGRGLRCRVRVLQRAAAKWSLKPRPIVRRRPLAAPNARVCANAPGGGGLPDAACIARRAPNAAGCTRPCVLSTRGRPAAGNRGVTDPNAFNRSDC